MAGEGVRVFCGSLVHATSADPLVILRDAVLVIGERKILLVDERRNLGRVLDTFDARPDRVRHLGRCEFLMPGFVDSHIHASQYSFLGQGLDRELLGWLAAYTFPAEARFSDTDYARDVYSKVVKRLVKNGTTTASYFATIHTDATLVLCSVVANQGQRAFVGKVNMDMESPEFYVETTKQSLEETERFIQSVHKMQNPLVTPIVTPRFAITCSSELMHGLGKLAQKYNLPIQTHGSENKDECAKVRKLFPDYESYMDLYDKHKLLTDKTIIAHGIYLSDKEVETIKHRDTAIAHCPNSNISIRSGLLNSNRIFKAGIKLGLGTDISGGCSLSMLDALRSATLTSKVLHITDRKQTHQLVTYKEAFRMATLGSSRVMGLDKVIGNFEMGKDFDALLVKVDEDDGPFDVFPSESIEEFVQKFVYLGDERNIQEVYVAGKCIHQRNKKSGVGIHK